MSDPNQDFIFQQAPVVANPARPTVGGDVNQDFLFAAYPHEPTTPALHAGANLWEDFTGGMQASVAGLGWRGKSPDTILQENASRADRLAYMAGQTLGDLPTLVVGGVGGALAGGAAGLPTGPGALVTGAVAASAGAMGLTEGARTWMLEQYKAGADRASLADRIVATLWATGKGAAIGGATGVVGGVVGGKLLTGAEAAALAELGGSTAGKMMVGGATKMTAVSSAELATMTTMSAALEGHLPHPDDFLDAAILLGGLHAAGHVTPKLMEIFRRTGKTPQEVVAAAHVDPAVAANLIDENIVKIPDEMRPDEKPMPVPPPELKDILQYPTPGSMVDEPHPLVIGMHNLNTTEDASLLLGRYTEVFARDIQDQRRGTITNAMAQAEAENVLDSWVGKDALTVPEHIKGTAESAAVIRARAAALKAATENVAGRIQVALENKGDLESQVELLNAMDQLRLWHKWAIGSRAESGRSLAAWNKAKNELLGADKQAMLKKIIEDFGGTGAANKAVEMLEEFKNNPVALNKMAKESTKFDTFLKWWKMGLLSGFRTQEVNLLSNIAFTALRIPKELMAQTVGSLRRVEGGSRISDSIGMMIGMYKGALEGALMASKIMKYGIDKVPGTIAKEGSEGKIGEATNLAETIAKRGTFDFLSAADAFTRTMNVRAEQYMQAMRILRDQSNWDMGDKGYWDAVHQLVNNPTTYMKERGKVAGERYTFQERQQGGIVSALHQFKHSQPWLNIIVPFDVTPAAIFREAARMTPLAPFVKKWREDISAGGARAEEAFANVALGTAIMTGVWYLTGSKQVSGIGGVTPEERRANRAAGIQPYSFYYNGRWISYNRMDPVGTVMGLAADLHDAWHMLDTPEKEKAGVALMYAFSNVALNKTWMKGLADTIAAVAHPDQDGAHWMESLAGSMVPMSGLMGQTAQVMDPYARDINSVLDAVKAKVPGLRSTLPLRYDAFGEEIPLTEGAVPFAGAAFPTTTQSTDKVRLEAARLGVLGGPAPRQINLRFPGRPADAGVQLTDEQRTAFAKTSGKMAYEVLDQQVNSPTWDSTPDMVKRQIYQKAFGIARLRGSIEALPMEQRAAGIDQLRQEYGL